ncbi:MAG: hypothetical protein Q7J35_05985 [Candidatus Methanoperedens sp.]|nr:hypothetical protein [Candidatus Methanoperedens sp.]
MKRMFVTAFDVAPDSHVRIQAVFQKYCDDAVSKTINFPNDVDIKEVEKAYMHHEEAIQLNVPSLALFTTREGIKKIHMGNRGRRI